MNFFKRSATTAATPVLALFLVIVMFCLAADASNKVGRPKKPGVLSRVWAKWMEIHFGFQFFIVLIVSTVTMGLLFGKW